MGLFCRECRAGAARTYMQSDLALHSDALSLVSANATPFNAIQPFPKQALEFMCLQYKSFD